MKHHLALVVQLLAAATFLVAGCQSYASLPDVGVAEDGESLTSEERSPGDEPNGPGDEPWQADDFDPHADCCGPSDDGPSVDCRAPGLPGQGPDLDGDLWGESCDCNDREAGIHPLAAEICDGLDNDCDGSIDEQAGCTCPLVGGEYWFLEDCLGAGPMRVELVQTGCQIEIVGLPFPDCSGWLDPSGRIEAECQGMASTCQGRVHRPGFPFGLDCGSDCWARFFPVQGDCTSHADCPVARSCQAFVTSDGAAVETMCWWGAGFGVDNTGAGCSRDGDCFSVWCLAEQVCAGLCLEDADCPHFPLGIACGVDADCPNGARCLLAQCARPSVCQTHVVQLDLGPNQNPGPGWVNYCFPERLTCQRDRDCPADQVCRLYGEPTTWQGFLQVCGPPGPGPGQLGDSCDGCYNGSCFWAQPEPGAVCSRLCLTDSDCVDPTGSYHCGQAQAEPWPGFRVSVQACVR